MATNLRPLGSNHWRESDGRADPDRPARYGGPANDRHQERLMIEARGLTKRYGSTTAVNDLSFRVESGRVTGFLGPNGAGKSTTMRMVLGLDRADTGQVRIDAKRLVDFPRPMRSVGALLDAGYLHPTRKARDHLWALAASNGLPRRRVDHVLGMVGLTDVAGKRVGAFSLGMKQRLGLAASMLGDPQTLVYDEPANGLDPEGILWMRNFLKGLADEGRTVFVSSHLLSEMALIADDLVVIGKGELIFEGAVNTFVDTTARKWVTVRSPQLQELGDALHRAGHQVVAAGPGAIDVVGPTAAEIGELASSLGATLHELSPRTASLEDVFLQVTAGAQQYRGDGDAVAAPPPPAPPTTEPTEGTDR
jgi:ABC-2 type transport system ATP-binding protein